MKLLLSSLISLLIILPAAAQTSAALAADLQANAAKHWPAIEDLLKAQRAELTAAHVSTLTAAAVANKTQMEDLTAQLLAARRETQQAVSAKIAAETELADNIKRQAQLVAAAEKALSSGNAAAKLAAVSGVLAEAQKSTDDRKRESLQKELDDAAATLAAKQAELEKLGNR